MKKTRRLVLLVIGVAALSAGSIGYSYAKYRREIPSEQTARLAKWTVNPTALSGSLDLFSGSYTNTPAGENDDASGGDLGSSQAVTANPIGFDSDNLLAPGAKGSTVVDFSGLDPDSNTEVAYQIKFVDIVPGTDGITNYVTSGTYGGADGNGFTSELANVKSAINFTATVKGTNQKVTGTLVDFETKLKTLTVPARDKVIVTWEWPYVGNDTQDTAFADLVDSGVDLRLVVRLAYQAVQID
ncbi:hypothetical protein [Pseudolactococcus reticulitermitis]|uniref:Uncharacterized protein n=1 Tax=Pseudolactococcus reticulitermitis TaxID=2025039 RepID=A0A224XAQ1_9LACT|nr:hypothetical protein [Lactococcus reticulitermitis]GAX48340.1 hypothetical protein RsY01_1961 [Lactococcus reticulitermitis]